MSKFHQSDIIHFTNVTLKVRSLERVLKFYEGILGFKAAYLSETKVSLSADGNLPLINLIEDKTASINSRHLGLYHFALLLPNRQSLAQFLLRLDETSYPLHGASDHGVSEALYLQDPEGNGIEIYIDKDQSEWPLKNGNIDMVSLMLDISGVMCELGNAPANGLPPETRIGHLHFHVASIKDAKHFYNDVIGFQTVMHYGDSALFVSDAGYHHHLGLNTWMPLKNNRKDNETGLVAYGLSVPDKNTLITKLKDNRVPYDEIAGAIVFNDILNQTIIVS